MKTITQSVKIFVTVLLFCLSTPAQGATDAYLEEPISGSIQSGMGVIRGWACSANTIEIELDLDPALRFQAAYGTARGDATVQQCGDDNNGFGLQLNWSNLSDGQHTIRALKDGQEFGRATFTVVTLGLGTPYVTGLTGSGAIANFPPGKTTTLQWQETSQNFVITKVLPGVPQLAASTSSVDFGSLITGFFSDQTMIVTNTGGGTLSGVASTEDPFSIVDQQVLGEPLTFNANQDEEEALSGVSSADPSSSSVSALSSFGSTFSLDANESLAITVRFTPPQDGTFFGTLEISTNAGNFVILLQGMGSGGTPSPPPSCSPPFCYP
jgi:hypothetical protein